MAINLLLPEMGTENASTKDKIISILSATSDLTTRKVHNILRKQYSTDVTYQAVHKIVKQMVATGVLKEDNHAYSINQEWINQLRMFVDKLDQAHPSEKAKTRSHKISDDLEVIEVETFKEAEEIFTRFRDEYFKNIENIPEGDRIICFHAPHLEIAIKSPRDEYDYMNKLLRNKTKLYCLCKGNTLVDKWIEKFYNSTDGHPYMVKTGANCSSINEVWIYPDKLVEVFFSEKFWVYFDEVYNSIKSIEDINYNAIVKKLYALNNEPVKYVIHKQKSLIRLGIKETLAQFGIKYKM